jgi:hypothetical protein
MRAVLVLALTPERIASRFCFTSLLRGEVVMARLHARSVAFLVAWSALLTSVFAQPADPYGNRPPAKPIEKILTGRDASGKPIESFPVDPNTRPILIDDTQQPETPPNQQRRIFGISRRGEVVTRPAESTSRAQTNAALREALQSPTRMEFTDMPLSDGIAYLKDYHQIEIQVDEPALQAVGVDTDTPVTRNLNDLPLGTSLKLLLEPIGLTYLVRDGVLMITTEAAADKHLELKVYDVTKLIGPEVKAEEVALMLISLNHPQMLGSGMGGGMGGAMMSKETTAVRVVPFRNLLIVRATQQEHEEIAGLFAELQERLTPED